MSNTLDAIEYVLVCFGVKEMKPLYQQVIDSGLSKTKWKTMGNVHTDLRYNGLDILMATLDIILTNLANQGRIKRAWSRGFTYYRRL